MFTNEIRLLNINIADMNWCYTLTKQRTISQNYSSTMDIHWKLPIGSGIGTILLQQKEQLPASLNTNECFSNFALQ